MMTEVFLFMVAVVFAWFIIYVACFVAVVSLDLDPSEGVVTVIRSIVRPDRK